MTSEKTVLPRSQTIDKSWSSLHWSSVFAAIGYPLMGGAVLALTIGLGLGLDAIALHWWYAPLALAVGAGSLFLCNMGIGPLHRIWQHQAGRLKWPAEILVALNAVIAMQGRFKDWISYHSQHHRFSDQPGDPHNPAEGKFWAWIGWLLWRGDGDLKRPLPLWLKQNRIVQFADRHYHWLALAVHLGVPVAAYAITWALGGPLALIAILHASAVIARGVHFHATTLGVNVFGHINTPKWLTWTLAVLTGGEALHAHHHEHPESALHLPHRGFINRLVDYNGTMLLVLGKLKLADNFKIAPQFLKDPL